MAVKVMDDAGDVERFRREARVLSEMSHPAIVRYVTHGRSETGEHFLVMEWLEGEDLAQRLAKGGLTVEESIAVLQRAAAGLAAAHARGVVHRDVKPSNLLLVDGDARRTKVLDFGIARQTAQTQTVTQSGTLLGTVGYMAPEQARGEPFIDARADVFALGCVLFECLTGRPAFIGRHAVAVLGKVLCEDPPRVSEVRPGLGEELDELVFRLLAKNREDRPADAAEVLRALRGIGGLGGGLPPRSHRAIAGLTDAERKVVSVILSEPTDALSLASDTSNPSSRDAIPPTRDSMAPSLAPESSRAIGWAAEEKARVSDVAKRFGAKLTWLEGGALLMMLSERGTAGDQAMQASGCALSLRRLYPELRIAVATGRAETLGRLPVGPAIDRAAALLHAQRSREGDGGAVLLDDLTGGLLDPRFEVERRGMHIELVGERGELEARRLLLGKATPCVGRKKELALLEATLDEAIADGAPSAVVVVAPPGTGKSRLASELLGRVKALDKAHAVVARADPIAVGSSLGLAQRLVRHAAGIHEAEPAAAQVARLRSYLERLAPRDAVDRLAEFLGELIDAPTDRAASAMLRSARSDPALMREQKRRAFHGWMDAESSSRPLLIVIEDLHWGDLATVTYLDEALRTLEGRPLMVLALGRPELYEQFPRLWEGHQQIRLSGLTPRAADRLARSVLGEGVPAAVVTRIVQLADGNAFYLEELIRRVAEHDLELPETVLAMAESRLDRLEPEARRVLRAASTFGTTLWSGGVASLLGLEAQATEWLEILADRELLVRAPESRFSGEREYQFRHALLRDAAYGTLTNDDRIVAHSLAAEWLEGSGEMSGRVLAEHFEKGGEPARAVPWIVRAAKLSLDGGDVRSAVELAKRGAALGADGEARGLLLVIEAEALGWDAQFDAALEKSRDARALLPEGTEAWWRATTSFVAASTAGGRPEEARPVIDALMSSIPDLDEHPTAAARACSWLVVGLIHLGEGPRAQAFLDRIGATEEGLASAEPVYAAWLYVAVAALALLVAADLGRAGRVARRSIAIMVEAGDSLGEAAAYCWAGAVAWETGLLDETLAAWSRVRELSDAAGGTWLKLYADFYIAAVRIRRGDLAGLDTVLATLCASTDVSAAQLARALTVELYMRKGRIEEALSEARLVAQGGSFVIRPTGEALVARILLAMGRTAEAVEAANRGLAGSSTINPEWLVWLLIARGEALHALGDLDGAREAIRRARDRVNGTAATLDDPAMRHSYLTTVESSVRALGLAREWQESEGAA